MADHKTAGVFVRGEEDEPLIGRVALSWRSPSNPMPPPTPQINEEAREEEAQRMSNAATPPLTNRLLRYKHKQHAYVG